MKLTLPFFVIASFWHSVHGQQESASLRGSGAVGATLDAEVAVAADFKDYESASTPAAALIQQEGYTEKMTKIFSVVALVSPTGPCARPALNATTGVALAPTWAVC